MRAPGPHAPIWIASLLVAAIAVALAIHGTSAPPSPRPAASASPDRATAPEIATDGSASGGPAAAASGDAQHAALPAPQAPARTRAKAPRAVPNASARVAPRPAFPCEGEDCAAQQDRCPNGTASATGECCSDMYFDDDGDAFGASYAGCHRTPLRGLVRNDLDCDDTRADVHPGLVELCDGPVDNDCDGFADPCGTDSHLALLPGDLEIVRAQDRTEGTPDWLGEWFEIANRTDRAVELMGLQVLDDGVDGFTIGRSLVLEPGGRAILGRNGDPRTNGGVAVGYVYSDFVLSNAGDSIELRSDSIAIDRVVYAEEGDLIPDLGDEPSEDPPATDGQRAGS